MSHYICPHVYLLDNARLLRRARTREVTFFALIALAITLGCQKSSQFVPQTIAQPSHAVVKAPINPYFQIVLEKTEGYENKFYLDNKGIAIAYGWNISQNSAAFNRRLANLMGLSRGQTKAIVSYSAKPLSVVPVALASIEIKKHQAQRATDYLYEMYMSDFEQVLIEKSGGNKNIVALMNSNFSDQQKAVFAHMSYKVGISGLRRYDTFFSEVISALDKKTITRSSVAKIKAQISYAYFIGDEKKYDTRVQKIHRDKFSARLPTPRADVIM